MQIWISTWKRCISETHLSSSSQARFRSLDRVRDGSTWYCKGRNICRTSPKNICRAPPKIFFVRGRYRQFNFEIIFDVQANDPPPSWLCFFSKLCSLSPRPCLVSKSWQTPIGCLLPKERTAAHHSWHFVQRKEVIWIYDLIKEDIKYHWCARIVGNGCIYTLPQKWSADFRDVPSPVCRHFLIFVAPKGLKIFFCF